MSKNYKAKTIKGGAGAMSLTLGILTLVFGITVGVLGIINGGRLLAHSGDEF